MPTSRGARTRRQRWSLETPAEDRRLGRASSISQFDDDAAVRDLAKLIERRRDELQRKAMGLAQGLFRKKPGKLVRPLEKAGVAA
jgi:hypothetical protein